jgi:hypothetical protein
MKIKRPLRKVAKSWNAVPVEFEQQKVQCYLSEVMKLLPFLILLMVDGVLPVMELPLEITTRPHQTLVLLNDHEEE